MHTTQTAELEEGIREDADNNVEEMETFVSEEMDFIPIVASTPGASPQSPACTVLKKRLIQQKDNLRKCKRRNVKLSRQLHHQKRVTQRLINQQVCSPVFYNICLYTLYVLVHYSL